MIHRLRSVSNNGIVCSQVVMTNRQKGRKMREGSKEQGTKEEKERKPLRILLHKLPFLQLSALQCDITYYFYHHPQRMRYRNVVQESERQDD